MTFIDCGMSTLLFGRLYLESVVGVTLCNAVTTTRRKKYEQDPMDLEELFCILVTKTSKLVPQRK